MEAGSPTRGGVEQQRVDRYKQTLAAEERQKARRHVGLCELEEHGRRSTKKIISWDVAPKQEYFEELFRVSRNQVIWGGNYFYLPPTRCFLVWEKLTISENFSMAMAEYAWTSFDGNAKIFRFPPQGKGDRFHPTQKPIELYKWILSRYAKDGDVILDTHVGVRLA